MKILLDENFPEGFIKKLSKLVHDVKHINHIKKGLKDKDVFDLALDEKRIIISNDIDFRSFHSKKHYGLIKFDSNIYDENILYSILKKYDASELKDNYIEISKRGKYFHRKIYSKKGRYKQTTRRPLDL